MQAAWRILALASLAAGSLAGPRHAGEREKAGPQVSGAGAAARDIEEASLRARALTKIARARAAAMRDTR